MLLKLTQTFAFSLFCIFLQAQVLETATFESAALGKIIPVRVYVPKDYNPNNAIPYPVYVYLHGAGGGHDAYYVNLYKEMLNEMIATNEIDPLIMVFPEAIGADFGNRHMWFNSQRNGNYADVVSEDLLQWLSENYHISETKRAIGGFSMGADGALRMAFHHPEKFVAAVGHSAFPSVDAVLDYVPSLLAETGQSTAPYTFIPFPNSLTEVLFGASSAWSPNIGNQENQLDLLIDENGMIDQEVFARWKDTVDVKTLIIKRWSESKKVPLKMYIDVDTEEDFYWPNRLLNQQLSELTLNEGYKMDFVYREYDGGLHGLNEVKIEASLKWLDEQFFSVVNGAEEAELLQKKLTIYPNPTNDGNIFVKYEGDIVDIQVFDVFGRKMLLPINVIEGSVQGEALLKGKYIIQVVTETSVLNQKIVVGL